MPGPTELVNFNDIQNLFFERPLTDHKIKSRTFLPSVVIIQ